MFSGMTIEELQTNLDNFNAQRDNLSATAKTIMREIESRRAQERVAQMPEAERAALLQAVQAQGVPSGEAFGKV